MFAGRYNTGGDPSIEADVLKSKLYDAEIFTVGVTNDVESEVLEEIASDAKEEHVFLFKDYADLGALISLLTNGTEGLCSEDGNHVLVLKKTFPLYFKLRKLTNSNHQKRHQRNSCMLSL